MRHNVKTRDDAALNAQIAAHMAVHGVKRFGISQRGLSEKLDVHAPLPARGGAGSVENASVAQS